MESSGRCSNPYNLTEKNLNTPNAVNGGIKGENGKGWQEDKPKNLKNFSSI